MKFYSRSTKGNHAKTIEEFPGKTAVTWFKHGQRANKPVYKIFLQC